MKPRSETLLILLLLLATAGCFLARNPSREDERVPERQLFRAVTSFYCDYKRWPRSLGELAGSEGEGQEGVGDVENLGEARSGARYLSDDVVTHFIGASTSSPRPTLFSVEYTSPSSANSSAPSGRRRASFIAPPTCGEQAAPGRVFIAGERVSFSVPEGFVPLSTAEVRERWGSGTAPDVAWSNPQATLTIAVRFGEAELTLEGMSRFKAGLEAAYARSVPGLVWIQQRLLSNGNPPLLVHEFESDSLKGRQRTIAYSLSFDRSLLSVTVSGDVSVGPEVHAAASLVRDTIIVK